MLLLVNLPLDILIHLQSYLLKDDIHYFLNSNKLHFSSLKQETVYFSLNQEKSREYVENERFREMILSKVKDASKQIGLSFNREYKISNIFSEIVAHKIDFGRGYPHLFKHVSSQFYLLPPEVKEIPFLPTLQDLELDNCVNLQDFSSLSHLKRLKITNAPHLIDITPLQNIPNLSFKKCPNIQDFSKLNNKRQKFVELHSLNQHLDVSPLYGINNVGLLYCSNIQDISCLGNHHRLMIFNCPSIQQGYECFKTVRHAIVIRTEVHDLSVFRDVKSLLITVFNSMENQLSLLKDIPSLNLRPPSHTDDFIIHRKEVYDISDLRNIRLSFFDDKIKISDTSFPSQLRHLQLYNCDQILKIINEGKTSIFCHLQSLDIRHCFIEHVNGLGDIPTLILQNCGRLHDVSGLGRNRYVELHSCPLIRDVSSLATVPIVTIRNCKGIVD